MNNFLNSPVDAVQQIEYNSHFRPVSQVHYKNTALVNLFNRLHINKILAAIDFTIPDSWNRTYFLYNLFYTGYIGVFWDKRYGLVNQICSFYGRDLYRMPTHILIHNEFFTSPVYRRIGSDAVVLKLLEDFKGVTELCSYYSEKLAALSTGIDINILNSALALIFLAKDKHNAEELKKIYDKIASGQPAVFTNKGALSLEDILVNPAKNNYIVTQMLDDMRTIENQFNTIVGIPNSNTDKKERLITSEVDSNNGETALLLDRIIENLNRGFNEINKIFKDSAEVQKQPLSCKRSEAVTDKGGGANVNNSGAINSGSGSTRPIKE